MKIRNIVFCALSSVLVLGCARTVQVRDVQPSGFLGDSYDLLEPGEGPFQAAMRYERPGADFGRYDRIILDPVIYYDDDVQNISAADRQVLANNLYISIRDALSKDYELVDQPQPGAVRFRIAIVEATPKNVTLDTMSTILPLGLAVSTFQQYQTGKPTFTGQLQVEFMVTDSFDGQLLVAGMDKRAGGKELSGDQFDSWSDVNQIIRFYGQLVRYRACQLRGDAGCVEPAAQNV